ncbi:unnamed product [Ostreococcus tauri]|uniref:Unnamed product n=1 Tax=Ostreococcus tauri TaxID=70448 RepID=Q00UU9_OSTTA|nr:unnamed product [Ostreococcus tauri]OUS45009.1 hypothetical protein BE221DRAFT_208275 [Ostreococcus tauri]CAL57678.1 unnamed product [Ostreococcus tauri]|eukprot:XP_003083402.1 unnamed product [Ostreococcus tauri]
MPEDDASAPPNPHVVLNDQQLLGTRVANAICDAASALSPCGGCQEVRERRSENDRDVELTSALGSPTRRSLGEDERGDWTKAYESFRATEVVRDRERDEAAVRTQFDECNARLREDLDAIEGSPRAAGARAFGTPAISASAEGGGSDRG